MKFTLNFGKHDYTGNGIKDNLVEVEVELRPVKHGAGQQRLSICGTIWNRLKTDCISAGQNLDEIRKLVGFSPLMKRVHLIWQRYHLNDMRAGSPRQEAYLAGYKKALETMGETEPLSHETRKDLLEKAGLQPDHMHEPIHARHGGYRYGSSWNYIPIPDDILAEIATWKEASE